MEILQLQLCLISVHTSSKLLWIQTNFSLCDKSPSCRLCPFFKSRASEPMWPHINMYTFCIHTITVKDKLWGFHLTKLVSENVNMARNWLFQCDCNVVFLFYALSKLITFIFYISVRSVGDSKLPVGVNVSVSVSVIENLHRQYLCSVSSFRTFSFISQEIRSKVDTLPLAYGQLWFAPAPDNK